MRQGRSLEFDTLAPEAARVNSEEYVKDRRAPKPNDANLSQL